MSAIVAAARLQAMVGLFTALSGTDEQCEVIRNELRAAGRAIVAASNAAVAGRVVAMRLADCGCVEVTHGCGTTRIDPFMPWKCDPRPCAWPRPFAKGADR